MGHEIRHTIDPHLQGELGRKGYDRIVDEAFAFYDQFISRDTQDWEGLERAVANSSYFETYSRQANARFTPELWQSYVKNFVADLKWLHSKVGSLEAQRTLVQAKSPRDLGPRIT